MRMRRTVAYLVFASCVLLVAVKNRAADVRSGDWTIRKSEDAGKVEFSLIEHHHGGIRATNPIGPRRRFRASISQSRDDRTSTSRFRAMPARSSAKGF